MLCILCLATHINTCRPVCSERKGEREIEDGDFTVGILASVNCYRILQFQESEIICEHIMS